MAKIRHIAIHANDQEAMKKFYIETFDMHVVPNPRSENGRAIYLSDGYINLAILPGSPNKRDAIGHFGFEVDDIEATGKRAAENGGSSKMAERPRDGRFAEYRIADTGGIGIDISKNGWDT